MNEILVNPRVYCGEWKNQINEIQCNISFITNVKPAKCVILESCSKMDDETLLSEIFGLVIHQDYIIHLNDNDIFKVIFFV